MDAFLDVAAALETAHAAAVVYQDVKIENVFVDGAGRGRLEGLEPPIAAGDRTVAIKDVLRTAALSVEQRLTIADVAAIESYLAPEQFRGAVADNRSNQFSFCVALYRALYGQLPFDPEWAASRSGHGLSRRTPLGNVHFSLFLGSFNRTTLVDLGREVLSGNVRPPPEDSGVPAEIERVIRRGLSTDPDERYPSMKALIEDVNGALGIPGPKPANAGRVVLKWLIVAAVGVVLAAVLVKILGKAPH